MPKVIKTTYCEKHIGQANYHLEDGSVIYGCPHCHPEIIEDMMKKTHKKITNYGDLYVNGSDSNHVVNNGHVEYTVPDHAADEFFNNCVDCGVDLEYGTNNVNGLKVVVYRSGAKNSHDKQWFSSNVYFLPNENFAVPPELTVHTKGNRMYVSSNDFAAYVLSSVLK